MEKDVRFVMERGQTWTLFFSYPSVFHKNPFKARLIDEKNGMIVV